MTCNATAGYSFFVQICDLHRQAVRVIDLIFSVTIRRPLRSNPRDTMKHLLRYYSLAAEKTSYQRSPFLLAVRLYWGWNSLVSKHLDVRELNNVETAAALSITVGNVKVRLHRSRLMLQKQLTPC